MPGFKIAYCPSVHVLYDISRLQGFKQWPVLLYIIWGHALVVPPGIYFFLKCPLEFGGPSQNLVQCLWWPMLLLWLCICCHLASMTHLLPAATPASPVKPSGTAMIYYSLCQTLLTFRFVHYCEWYARTHLHLHWNVQLHKKSIFCIFCEISGHGWYTSQKRWNDCEAIMWLKIIM